ncbi:hypothetical protein GCM10025872_32980 [Barrientosiimonas endolithica]|uniref:Nucleotide pyrophosphohydrolase n=1 Tax=Barrientosiimonas endolithica TaxID=1535208 RepID=A0ABM8HF53_9MICO|nr:hypothetical protein GCM10025872_32980 [Barrientosiimonas endolithica]
MTRDQWRTARGALRSRRVLRQRRQLAIEIGNLLDPYTYRPEKSFANEQEEDLAIDLLGIVASLNGGANSFLGDDETLGRLFSELRTIRAETENPQLAGALDAASRIAEQWRGESV